MVQSGTFFFYYYVKMYAGVIMNRRWGVASFMYLCFSDYSSPGQTAEKLLRLMPGAGL